MQPGRPGHLLGPGDKDWGWGGTRGPTRTRPARRGAPGASSSSPGPSGAPRVDRLPPRTAEHAGPAVGACGCPRPRAPRTQAPRPDTHLGGRVPGRAPPVGVQRQAGGAGRPDSLPASACRAKTSAISVPPPHSASSAPLWGAGSQDGATPTGTAPAPGHEAHGGAGSWALWPHSRLPPAEQPDPQPSGGWPRSGDPAGAEQCHRDGCGLGLDVPSPRGAVSAQAVPTSPSVCLSIRWTDGRTERVVTTGGLLSACCHPESLHALPAGSKLRPVAKRHWPRGSWAATTTTEPLLGAWPPQVCGCSVGQGLPALHGTA